MFSFSRALDFIGSITATATYRQLFLSVHRPFSKRTWVSRYQNVSIMDFPELRVMEVVVATGDMTCKAPVKSSPPTNQHPVFTGRMPFLSPNQQCQSTEEKHSSNCNVFYAAAIPMFNCSDINGKDAIAWEKHWYGGGAPFPIQGRKPPRWGYWMTSTVQDHQLPSEPHSITVL